MIRKDGPRSSDETRCPRPCPGFHAINEPCIIPGLEKTHELRRRKLVKLHSAVCRRSKKAHELGNRDGLHILGGPIVREFYGFEAKHCGCRHITELPKDTLAIGHTQWTYIRRPRRPIGAVLHVGIFHQDIEACFKGGAKRHGTYNAIDILKVLDPLEIFCGLFRGSIERACNRSV